MTQDIHLIVLIGIFIYMAAMLLIGYWSSRQIKNLADFLVAGRRLPFFLATATLFATWFGAGSCMGAAGTAYSDGILGVISDPFAAGLSLVLAGVFFVALLRRLKLLTITDIFGKYYSKGSEIFASILMVPVYIGWLGAQMVALGYLVHTLTGIDPLYGIVLGAFIVLIYTFAGGMWAVTLTDVVQVVILILGLFIILPATLMHIGGLGELIKSTPGEFWRVIPPKGTGYYGWMSYFGQWALMGLGCIVGQDLIQRSLASKNEKVAKYSAITAGVGYVFIGIIPILLGFAGRIVFPGIADPELVIPGLAIKFLSLPFLMLFLGALISAIMSSADSSLLAATSLTTKNIILELFPRLKQKEFLPLARYTTVVLAVVSMLVALYVKEIYNLMVNSWATLFVGILVPVTAALYWKKANKEAAWASMLLGTGTWIGYIIIKTGNFQEIADPIFYTAAAYGGIVSLLSYLIVTFARYKKIKPIKLASSLPPAD
jgi:SSS family transporter